MDWRQRDAHGCKGTAHVPIEEAMSTAALRMTAAHMRSAVRRRAVPRVGLGALLRNADMAFNRVLREELARHDITFSQFQHLWQLWTSDGLAQVELSRRIGIETASSTAVIDQLEKRGLIARA